MNARAFAGLFSSAYDALSSYAAKVDDAESVLTAMILLGELRACRYHLAFSR
jgi:hypothetical protein